ncbi:MAG: hypothetical protein ACHQNE_04625 [Candidatus Kapaibacterium sp.]
MNLLRRTFSILLTTTFIFFSAGLRAQSTEDTTAPPASSPSTLQTFLNQTHIGGYGEITYKDPNYGDVPRLNIPRMVTFIEHDFNAQWEFKSELELEDVKLERGAGGEIEYEQAFLDYHANPHIGLRAGLQLIPIGIINQTHEPTTYYSVERPQFDQSVIVTEWEEIGAQFYGEIAQGVEYQLMLSEGLKAEGLSMTTIDGAKQSGSAGDITTDAIAGSDASHPAISGRLDFLPIAGLRLGASAYYQPIAFDTLPAGASGTFLMAMLDARFEHGPLRLSGEGGFFTVSNDAVNFYQSNPNYQPIPQKAVGGWVEAAYNVMPFFSSARSELLPFVLYESFTFTGHPVASFFLFGENTLSIAHNSVTAGMAFKPLDNIIFKADYRMTTVDGEADYKQFSLGGGFNF